MTIGEEESCRKGNYIPNVCSFSKAKIFIAPKITCDKARIAG